MVHGAHYARLCRAQVRAAVVTRQLARAGLLRFVSVGPTCYGEVNIWVRGHLNRAPSSAALRAAVPAAVPLVPGVLAVRG